MGDQNLDAVASSVVKRPESATSRARYDLRRQEVVDAAARVYARHGYHGTTVDDLVAETGLKRGGLYHYIDGKHDLLVAIHDRFMEPLLESSKAVLAEPAPPDEKLRGLARVLMSIIARYQDHVTVFLNDWRSLREGSNWEHIHAARRDFETLIENVLSEGREASVFETRGVRLPTMAFLGMINYSYQWYDRDGSLTPNDIADELVAIFLEGVRPRTAVVGARIT